LASRRSGFSFIELLVVVTIIGVLIALLLPAVNAAREAARRSNCQHNLSQLILAVHNYQNMHEFYPPGTIDYQGPIRNIAQGYHHNWIVQTLPFFEQGNAWRHIDQAVGVYHPRNAPVASLHLEILECPSQVLPPTPQSCYAGVHHDVEAPIDVDNNGVFFLNSRVRYEDVTDGTAQTIFIGEIPPEKGGLGWMSGTRATLRNAGVGSAVPGAAGVLAAQSVIDSVITQMVIPPEKKNSLDPLLVVGGFGSFHPGGSQFAFGDGHTQFLASAGTPLVRQLLAHRADGRLLDEEAY
jgi:prepilin-type N-terminal cleavage/methylation domain-containing protein/prepilin-type processing-associated H-X9-DG protein